MQIFIKKTFLIRTIKEIVLLSFQAYKHDHSLHARKTLFLPKHFKRYLKQNFPKEMFLYFSYLIKHINLF